MGEESGEVSERVKGLYRKDSLKIINLKAGSVALYFREDYTGDRRGPAQPRKTEEEMFLSERRKIKRETGFESTEASSSLYPPSI